MINGAARLTCALWITHNCGGRGVPKSPADAGPSLTLTRAQATPRQGERKHQAPTIGTTRFITMGGYQNTPPTQNHPPAHTGIGQPWPPLSTSSGR